MKNNIDNLLESAKNGDLTGVQRCIKNGTDINLTKDSSGWTALMYASACGYLEIVKYLADNSNINIRDYDGKKAIHYAQSKEIFKYLESLK